MDYVYVYCFELGEKINLLEEFVEKLLKVLKFGDRDGVLIRWLVDYFVVDLKFVEFVLGDLIIGVEIFIMVVGIVYWGNIWFDFVILIVWVWWVYEDDDEEE